jgi:hypothetical protein
VNEAAFQISRIASQRMSKISLFCAIALQLAACGRTALLEPVATLDASVPSAGHVVSVVSHASDAGASTGALRSPTPDAGPSNSLSQDVGRFVDAGMDASVASAADGGADAAAVDASFPARNPVTISYTTLDQHHTFSPRNVGAAWIEDGSGRFIKTLDIWALPRMGRLTAWLAASGGSRVDAVSSATAPAWGPRQCTWDMSDASGTSVPDGDYTLKVEITDYNYPGPVFSIPIRKGSGAVDTNPPDQAYLANITVHYQ